MLDCAQRELVEETGVTPVDARLMHQDLYVSGGGTSERLSLVLALVDMRKAGGVHGHAQENEDIRSIIMPASDFISLAKQGKLRDVASVIAAHYLEKNRPQIRRDFARASAKTPHKDKSATPVNRKRKS